MLISHTPLIQEKQKNQQLGRAQLTLHILLWTQRTYSEASWATSGETTRVCVIPSSAHIEHWLQFYEVKMPKKKKMWRRCPQSFLSREGITKEQATASGYWEQSLRLSVIGYYGSLTFAAFTCLSTTDPCISLCGDVRESVYRVFQPLPLNNDFVILDLCGCWSFSQPLSQIPLGDVYF